MYSPALTEIYKINGHFLNGQTLSTFLPDDKTKVELQKQGTELKDVNRTRELPDDKTKEELQKQGTDLEDPGAS